MAGSTRTILDVTEEKIEVAAPTPKSMRIDTSKAKLLQEEKVEDTTPVTPTNSPRSGSPNLKKSPRVANFQGQIRKEQELAISGGKKPDDVTRRRSSSNGLNIKVRTMSGSQLTLTSRITSEKVEEKAVTSNDNPASLSPGT